MPYRFLALSFAVTGCSLIYNPSNLPDLVVDADTADTPIADADPSMLTLTSLAPDTVLEGQGAGGSAPAVLVVLGKNIVEGATLVVEPQTPNPDVTITTASTTIAADGNSIAALVTVQPSMIPEATGPITLVVAVKQPPPNDSVMATLLWTFTPLDNLTMTGTQASPPDGKLYADVAIAGDVTFSGGATSRRAIVRAVSSIAVTGTNPKVSASAVSPGQAPGPGGCSGGGGGTEGECNGAGQGAMGLLTGGGGGAGFVADGTAGSNGGSAGKATGNAQIASYTASGAAENKSAGGGGGGTGGAAGGGGGGTLELTAGGDLTLTGVTIQADGAKGGASITGGGGGGGAGGIVVLRSGGTLMAPTAITVSAGAGGTGGTGAGGKGADGRIRFDATSAVTITGAHRSPMFVRPASPIVRSNSPTLTVNGSDGDTFTVVTKHPDGTSISVGKTFIGATTTVTPTLAIGLNQVCALVKDGNIAEPEAANCIQIAFLP